MKIYGGIGSRGLNEQDLELCTLAGIYLAQLGWTLHTGACKGADQAFANGALAAGGRVTLFLPWPNYESVWVNWARSQSAEVKVISYKDQEAYESVKTYHPASDRLSRAAQNLHARNYLIVQDCKFVLAFPGKKLGGTGQGIRVCNGLGIEVLRLDMPMDRYRVESKLKG